MSSVHTSTRRYKSLPVGNLVVADTLLLAVQPLPDAAYAAPIVILTLRLSDRERAYVGEKGGMNGDGEEGDKQRWCDHGDVLAEKGEEEARECRVDKRPQERPQVQQCSVLGERRCARQAVGHHGEDRLDV